MADHREAHTRHESEGDTEFSFWNSSNTTIISPNIIDCGDQHGGTEARFNREAVFGEKSKRKNSKLECSPFLPRSHHCNSSASSDPSRSKAIEEGRKELMEMMQGMPESSFELSFQDMVVEKQAHQEKSSEEKTLPQSSSSGSSNSSKALIKKPSDKKKSKSIHRPGGQIMRVESMDSETFLLKMFFPTSLKKVKVENGSKVSPKPSLLESVKLVAKDWRVKSVFQAGGSKGHADDDSISKNTCSKSDKSRHFDRDISLSKGCWSFFQYTKSEKKQLGG